MDAKGPPRKYTYREFFGDLYKKIIQIPNIAIIANCTISTLLTFCKENPAYIKTLADRPYYYTASLATQSVWWSVVGLIVGNLFNPFTCIFINILLGVSNVVTYKNLVAVAN